MKILNLTQHNATADQVAAGVIEPSAEDKQAIQAMLTFAEPPTKQNIEGRADLLARIAEGAGATKVMIGGAPYLMGALEKALQSWGIQPLYAFSAREVVEEQDEDGAVTKRTVFRHAGWVEVSP